MTDKKGSDQSGTQVNGPKTDIDEANAPVISGNVKTVNFNYSDKIEKPLIPCQIPPPPPDFTGREQELKKLQDAFEQGSSVIGLRGMGGVGKTALALILVKRLAERYPDGQVFVDMKGTSNNPLNWTEAMIQIIHAYEPEFKMPMNEGELPGKYFSMLHGKKALLLLDNAASREQVEPLLPPKNCALLVTSRKKFAFLGLAEKDLDVLPLEDAKKLLLEICGRIGDHASELAEICGRLPIALRNAASILRERPNLDVDEYIKRLSDAKNRLKLVDASFSTSYDLLNPELQRLWSLLSVFPADFYLAGAAAVWDMEETPTEDALGDLIRWSLVDFQPSATGDVGRYKLHDLARDFAGSCLMAEEKEQAEWRHAKYYLKVLLEANDYYNDCKRGILEGLRIFDSDETNILKVYDYLHQAVTGNLKGASRELALRLLCYYPYRRDRIFAHRLQPEKRIKFLDALYAADELSCLEIKMRKCSYLGDIGIAYAYLGRIDEAIESHKKQLETALKNKEQLETALKNMGKEEADANYNIGKIKGNIGKIDEALELLERAASAYNRLGDYRGELKSIIAQGIIYRYLGEVKRAIKCHEQARRISEKNKFKREEAYALNNLGNDQVDKNMICRALINHGKALKIDKDIKYLQGQVADLGNIGYAYAKNGESKKAIQNLSESIKLAQLIRDPDKEATAEAIMGMVCEEGRNYCKAKEHYAKACKIVKNINFKRRIGQAHINLGNVYAAEGDYSKAIANYRKAKDTASEIKDCKGIAKCEAMLGKVCEKQTNYDAAIKHYEKALRIVREIKYYRREAHALENLGDVYKAKGEPQKALSYYNDALAICRRIRDAHKEKDIVCKIEQINPSLTKDDRP